jgi:hypothetical protein
MSSEASTEGERRWLPLESNPDVLNPFIARLGCPEAWGFTDVYGQIMQSQYAQTRGVKRERYGLYSDYLKFVLNTSENSLRLSFCRYSIKLTPPAVPPFDLS